MNLALANNVINELIDKFDAVDFIDKHKANAKYKNNYYRQALRIAQQSLNNSVGHWIEKHTENQDNEWEYICSECGKVGVGKQWCEHCGKWMIAPMEEYNDNCQI